MQPLTSITVPLGPIGPRSGRPLRQWLLSLSMKPVPDLAGDLSPHPSDEHPLMAAQWAPFRVLPVLRWPFYDSFAILYPLVVCPYLIDDLIMFTLWANSWVT